MNNDFRPFFLIQPQKIARRRERPRLIPLSPEKLERRQEIARMLIPQVAELSNAMRSRSEEERKAIILKLEHEKPISLSGRDLKSIAEPTSNFTLAVPRTDNLDKLQLQIEQFGQGELDRGKQDVAYLTAIKQADPKDRLSQELYDNYDELIQQEQVICEIEILSVAPYPNQRRAELQSSRSALQRAFANGLHGTIFEQEEIKGTCRAVIRCTGAMFRQLVEEPEWQRRISWFEPRPRFETFHTTFRNFNIQKLGRISGPMDEAPIVCIVDSGVTIGNPFLQPIAREDLVRSFLRNSPDNPFDQHGHGSGVASLAAYYALNIAEGADNQGKIWIASARVLDANNQLEDSDLGDSDEPDPTYLRLFSRVLVEVVETFVPHGVKIFNLSVGITNRKWNAESKRTVPRRSWIARTIDRLCREKDIIFVISTGNISVQDVRAFTDTESPYPKYFIDDESSILDPGQAALAVTVGSIAPGTLVINTGRTSSSASPIALTYQPSPFTRCGPGINKEIKPELVELGGNYLIEEDGSIRPNPGTNVLTASHQQTPAISHFSGTSFAAPRVAHRMALIQQSLESFGLETVPAHLIKAFTINSASYKGDADIDAFKDEMNAVQTNFWRQILGYGSPDETRALTADPYSAILFFQGTIEPNTVLYFDIPVPVCLIETGREKKRLTVTVVHVPQVQRWGLERYLGTTLKWRMFRGDIQREEIISAMSIESEESENTDVELPNELSFDPGINQRSRGTIQHGIHTWNVHKEEHSENVYTLAVASYERWGRSSAEPDPLAIVIRIEDLSRQVQVYAEVQQIMIELEVQSRAQV